MMKFVNKKAEKHLRKDYLKNSIEIILTIGLV